MNAKDRRVLGDVYEALNAISSPPGAGSASTAIAALADYARRAEKIVWPAMVAISELRAGDPDGMAMEWASDALRAAGEGGSTRR